MKLYRFEKVESRRLEALKSGQLWFSSPSYFNDLSDSIISLYFERLRTFSYKSRLEALRLMYEDVDDELHPLTIEQRKTILRMFEVLDDERATPYGLRKMWEFYPEALSREIARSTAICCFFAQEPTSPLMWAHYGDSHQGFCVEYEVNDSGRFHSELRPVTYLSSPNRTSIQELVFVPDEALKRIVTCKSSHWSYENEYRLVKLRALKDKHGELFDRPPWLIPTRIICGNKLVADDGLKPTPEMSSLSQSLAIPLAAIISHPHWLQIKDVSEIRSRDEELKLMFDRIHAATTELQDKRNNVDPSIS